MSVDLEKTSSSSNLPQEIIETILSKLPSNLPQEIVETILSKLPVKSLLRFKTVSKSWNAMISDPVFARIHLQSSNSSPNNLMYLNTKIGIYLFKFDGGKFNPEAVLENPYRSRGRVSAECNGVLLLTKDVSKGDRHTEYALWNRSTRMVAYFGCPFIVYGIHPHTYTMARTMTQGMCYDPITDDFKVVFIDTLSKIRIYSCKNNSWTEKEEIGLFYACMTRLGIFVDGAIYWVLMEVEKRNPSGESEYSDPTTELVYFDPRTDELKRLQKPKEINDRNDEAIMEVASFRDSLCFCCYTRDDDGKTNIKIWRKEKGILGNPNWEEFVIIENVSHVQFSRLRLVCFVGNKMVIRLAEKRYVYYSPSEKTIEKVEEGDGESWGAFIAPYLDSLFFPTGVTKSRRR